MIIIALAMIGLAIGATETEAIFLLRKVAQDASSGKVTQDTGAESRSAAAKLNIGCSGVGNEKRALEFIGNEISATAVVETQPKLLCPSIREQFLKAKAYWAELTCIIEHVLWTTSSSQPNLTYLKYLTNRAETLRKWIEIVFPSAWDERKYDYIRSWRPKDGPIPEFQLTKLKWGGLEWKPTSLPPGFEITLNEGSLVVKQLVSVANFCLEPQRGEVQGYMGEAPLKLRLP